MDAIEYRTRHKELFNEWRKSEMHRGKLFNEDGIVNPEIWFQQEKRILFVLKEAYHKDNCEQYDLAEDLSKNEPWSNMWNRVAEWSYGILNTTRNFIADYKNVYDDKKLLHDSIDKIAVINVKKSSGQSTSDLQDIQIYAEADKLRLKDQVDLINPTIIVCGYTFSFFNTFYCNEEIKKKEAYNPNCFYNYKGLTILDYYHPALQGIPAFMSFYALCSIYQKSLR